jgi:hypothetical protein
MVDPKIMCNQHLLGEHVEIHMLVGCLNRNKNINGYISGGLVEVQSIKTRHDRIVKEMLERGMNHNTPIENNKMFECVAGHVDVENNIKELGKRCKKCNDRKNYIFDCLEPKISL